MTKNNKLLNHTKFVSYVSIGFVLAALTYLAMKSFLLNTDPVDFKYIWLAGHMWNNSLNPYSVEFGNLGHKLFSGYNEPDLWFYPPNWWPVAKTIAFLPYEIASTVWRTLSASLILLGSLLVIKSYQLHIASIHVLRSSIFLFYVSAMFGTAISLSLGQTSGLIYFGLTCFIAAYINGSKLLMVFAVSILMLKPHIGIVACGFLLTSSVWISTIIWAAIISILMSFPALKLAGIESFITEFLAQSQAYGKLTPNTPQGTTGLRYLASSFFNWNLSILSLTGIGFLSSTILGWNARKNQKNIKNEVKLLSLCMLVSLIILLIPMHSYDLIIIGPMIILMAGFNPKFQFAIFTILTIFFHTDKLAVAIGLYKHDLFPGNDMISIGALVLFICLVALYRQLKSSDKT